MLGKQIRAYLIKGLIHHHILSTTALNSDSACHRLLKLEQP